jgi:hypothetical protein
MAWVGGDGSLEACHCLADVCVGFDCVAAGHRGALVAHVIMWNWSGGWMPSPLGAIDCTTLQRGVATAAATVPA